MSRVVEVPSEVLSVRLPTTDVDRLKFLAESEGRSISDVLRRALRASGYFEGSRRGADG